MKEQSHKDEMSRALRGDFERLRERGVAATLAPRPRPVTPQEPEAIAEPELPLDREEDPVAALSPPPPAEAAPEPEDEPDDSGVTTSRPGLFARLIGR